MARIPINNVTTTGTLEGWIIEEYCGPVSATVVAGAGFVTEFFANFTDFWGGQSGSVRNRLQEIHDHAGKQIRTEGGKVGANWIIGYRIDFDEISGKNNFMFMVTATGTAVRARRTTIHENDHPTRHDQISATEIARLLQRDSLAQTSDTNSIFASQKNWSIVIANRMGELADAALDWAAKEIETGYDQSVREEARRKVEALFGAIPQNQAVEILYASALKSPIRASLAIDLMQRNALMDAQKSLQLLQSAHHAERRFAVATASAHQSMYTPADLATIDQLIALAPQSFPPFPLVLGQGLIKQREVWHCECGKEVNAAAARCTTCSRDRRGFKADEIHPEMAVSKWSRLRRILAEKFAIQ